MKKTHYDRIALIDRLEKKYAKKVQLRALKKQQKQLERSLRYGDGEDWYDDIQDKATDIILRVRHTAA
jgi:hypothetical protein